MFESLSDRLGIIIKKIKGCGSLSDANIQEALKDVRMALLEADVNFTVVKDFIERVKNKAIGKEVLESLTPGQQFIKIVRDELVEVLGGISCGLELGTKPPAAIMIVGLQGSGKTTTTAKLARYLKSKGRNPYLVSADIYRPAAMLQLKRLAGEINVDVFDAESMGTDLEKIELRIKSVPNPQDITREANRIADIKGYDTVLVDTAGRLHIDSELMEELKELKAILKPKEILFVADSMTGQDAVNTARGFDEAVGITGIILTKLDGDTRGGAALSIKNVTGKPIKFIGVGEKMDAIEPFYPDRMASRILGMGDVLTLIEKAQEFVDEKKAKELEKKIKKDTFTLEDFGEQLRQIKKMGSLESIIAMVPGFKEMQKKSGVMPDEKELFKTEAIINSMTKKERLNHTILNANRRKRIANGSGTSVQDVNKLVKQYLQTREMMKRFSKGRLPLIGGRGFSPF
ncbi:MAG TPA: signal recognition particle protein [Thermodesulfobacteriota bacterium]|nr:signal recognition particle protein [Thermodesulfobacteriota bacterium]